MACHLMSNPWQVNNAVCRDDHLDKWAIKMSVKQFSANYLTLEDRIQLSLNTTNGELYGFLLTRAQTQAFLRQCDNVIEEGLKANHDERSSKLIQEFHKDKIKKEINFEESFEGGDKAPLGKESILVAGTQVAMQSEMAAISLLLVSDQQVSFSLALGELQAVIVLIEKLAVLANWRITEIEEITLESAGALDYKTPSHLH